MLAMASVTDSTPETDESLMLRYAGGNLKAFNLLYDRHEMGVWRYVFRSVRIQAVADDLLQDVWFALARQAPHYQPCLLYTSPSPRDRTRSRMPSSA